MGFRMKQLQSAFPMTLPAGGKVHLGKFQFRFRLLTHPEPTVSRKDEPLSRNEALRSVFGR